VTVVGARKDVGSCEAGMAFKAGMGEKIEGG
jgi:hypothetical protein